ncbi:MAG: putative porin [Bacteroidia bacterium]|nr:putative porin [Bacteroidia bacterium]
MKRIVPILLLLSASPFLHAQGKDIKPKAPKTIREWTLSSDFMEEVTIPFDTVFSLFHRYRISDRQSPVNATLGNYGLPFYPISFFDRVFDPDKYLYSNYYPFMYHSGNTVFMDTQVPFTELVWTYGAPRETSEQTFRVRHSQNVNKFFNFGLIYDIIYSLGQYNYQRAEDKTFTFHSSYTVPKYKAYFATGINNIVSYENGGLTKPTDDPGSYDSPRDIPVNLGSLNVAKNILKNQNILLVQRYTIGGQPVTTDSTDQKKKGFLGLSGTFSHILIWENTKRTYSDIGPEYGFYDTIYISNSTTFDSLYSRNLKNTLRFDFTTDESRKIRIGGGVGLRNELFRYSQIIPTHDPKFADTARWDKSNYVLVGRLYNNIGEKFRWNAKGELILTGYRAGDFSLAGEIVKSFAWEEGTASWLINGSIINRQPSFWYEQWGGNNFEWSNNFKKEFRIDIGTSFIYPALKAEVKLNYAIIDNYTDFNTSAIPSQHEGGLSVAALTARKEFRAWKFHFTGDVIVQKSSNPDILDLPLAAARAAIFFEHHFRFRQTNGKLSVQMGADAMYHTLYYPYSYMPATGRFYRQDQEKTGNYPFINVFLNLKIKRTRFFIMMDHLNSGFMGNNYYMIPSYPMNIRMLRYGLAWTFYN